MKVQDIDFCSVFVHLDEYFRKQRSVEDKKKYLNLKNTILEHAFKIENIINHEYADNRSVHRELKELFITLGILKDKYFELVSVYFEKKVNSNSWIKSKRNNKVNDLTNFYWFESARKIRNKFAHDDIEPVIDIEEGCLLFNYFYIVDGGSSKVPFLHHNNNSRNLVNLKKYGTYMLGCLSRLILNIDNIESGGKKQFLSPDMPDLEYSTCISDIESQTRDFIGLFEYTKGKCEDLVNAHRAGGYSSVDGYYLAELYLNYGTFHAKDNSLSEALDMFKVSISFNHDIAQVSNIIGACAPDSSMSSFVHELINDNLQLAYDFKYVQFFGNATYYLSELDDDELTEKVSGKGLVLIGDNKESVDFLYNYAHFLKNKKCDYSTAINLCLKIIEISPIDKGAHKMLLDLYYLTQQYEQILTHVECYIGYIKNEELLRRMSDYRDAIYNHLKLRF